MRPEGKFGWLRRAAACGLAAGALWIGAAVASPAHAHGFARLAGGVDVECSGPSAEYRVEVRNAGARPVILTHALFFFQRRLSGENFWRTSDVVNLLAESEKGGVDHVLSPGEQKARAAIVDFVPTEEITHVRGILLVHVFGEPFWRFAIDVDACR